jgi:hypothetical protein
MGAVVADPHTDYVLTVTGAHHGGSVWDHLEHEVLPKLTEIAEAPTYLSSHRSNHLGDTYHSVVARLNAVVAYRDNMLDLARQLTGLRDQVGKERGQPLEDGIKFYALVAADLTKIIEGEALAPFTVTGVLPDQAV